MWIISDANYTLPDPERFWPQFRFRWQRAEGHHATGVGGAKGVQTEGNSA